MGGKGEDRERDVSYCCGSISMPEPGLEVTIAGPAVVQEVQWLYMKRYIDPIFQLDSRGSIVLEYGVLTKSDG